MDNTPVPMLAELIGLVVTIAVPAFHPGKQSIEVKLRGVEAGGVWIESQIATEGALAAAGAHVSRNTPVFFVPFAQIVCILSTIDVPGVSSSLLR